MVVIPYGQVIARQAVGSQFVIADNSVLPADQATLTIKVGIPLAKFVQV